MTQEQQREQRLIDEALSQDLTKGIDETNFVEIVRIASAKFVGNLHVLQSAIGALMIGRLYGWRVLKIVLTYRTFKRYQELLGVEFKNVCPERGVLYEKSIACAAVDKSGVPFWKFEQRVAKIDCRRVGAN